MKHYHVYGIGAALVDTEIEVKDADLAQLQVDKGVMTLVDENRQQQLIDELQDHLVYSKRASGGSAANSVIAVSYFGGRTFYSCKVANDENGWFYLDDLRAAGVDYPTERELEDGITGKCLVMITPDAERTMNTYLGISETVSVADLHEAALRDSHYAYMEGYLVSSTTGREAAITLREMAEVHGVKTALSFSDPGIVEHFKGGLEAMVGNGVDLLFCNEAEALSWTGASDLDSAANQLKDVARQFAITRGARGALLFDGQRRIDIDAHKVTAVDSNGAGDMFAGAFLYATTHGYSFRQAGDFASLAAATVVSDYGPRLRPEQHQQVRKRGLGH